jgi:2'-5' RNA ligase
MHRLFVAIRPPAEIRGRLLDLMEGLNGASWQDEDQLHITLRFIGEVERPVAEDIAAELARIRASAFQLALDGIGSFGRGGRPAILWAGLTPHAPLKALHDRINQAIVRAGVEADHRAYRPHITLARLGRSAAPPSAFVAQASALASEPFAVDAFGLYESELTPAGAIHTLVERYQLTAAANSSA